MLHFQMIHKALDMKENVAYSIVGVVLGRKSSKVYVVVLV